MKDNKNNKEYAANDTVNDIINAVKGLDYGIITIKVHKSKIVQIDITQKKRYDDVSQFEKGGGI
jgi:hypothetical protein